MAVRTFFGLIARFRQRGFPVHLGERENNPTRLFSTASVRNPLLCLTDEQKLQYEEHGWLVVKDVFDAEEVLNLRKALDDITKRSISMTESDDILKLEPGHSPSKPLVQRVVCPSLLSPVFHQAIRHPKLLDIMCDLIGPSIRYTLLDRVNMKGPSGVGSAFLWHQDWAFRPHTNDDVVTVGVAWMTLPEKMVIPGTHRGPIYSHFDDEGAFAAAITDSTIDSGSAVHLEAPAGGVTLHNSRLVHGSAANQSNHARRVYIINYGAADAWPLLGVCGQDHWHNTGPVDWERFCSTLVRGKVTVVPRMENVPVPLPVPFEGGYDILKFAKTTVEAPAK